MSIRRKLGNKASRRRRSAAIGLEALEGRGLMASLAVGGSAIFTLGSDGTVFVNQQRFTADQLHPFHSAGLVALPGIKATSIAGFQTSASQNTFTGLPEVVATTGSQSYVYKNVDEPTGDPTAPYAWSGWQAIGNFVAKSIVSGADQGISTNAGAVFAIGADSNVYESVNAYDSSTTFTNTFSDFQQIPGLSASSLNVIDDGGGKYRIFALTGPQSYIYQADVATSGTSTTVQPTAWSMVSTSFIAGSLATSPPPSSATVAGSAAPSVSLFATGGDGHLYQTLLTPGTGSSSPAPFQMVGKPSELPATLVGATALLISDNSVNKSYQTIVGLASDGSVAENQITGGAGTAASPYVYSGWVSLGDLSGTSIVATFDVDDSGFAANAGLEVVARSSNGVTFVKRAPYLPSPVAGTPAVNLYLAASNIAIADHPLAVATGVNGRPVVATIGNDGTVYVDQDVATSSTTTTTDAYSGFTTLAGLNAITVAAAAEPDGIAVIGLTSGGNVYVDQYRPTLDVQQAYAWTGWVQVAQATNVTSIAAVTAGGSSSNGPTLILGQGTRPPLVFSSSPPANEKLGYNFSSTPTTLAGEPIGTMSVKATVNGIEVAILTGPQSYPLVDLYGPDAAGNLVWSGWQQVGAYVMNQVFASTGEGGIPAIAGNSPFGQQVFSEYLQSSNAAQGSAWTSFRPLPSTLTTAPSQSVPAGYLFQTLTSVAYPNGQGGVYLDVFAPRPTAVFGYEFVPGSTPAATFTGNPIITPIAASSVATTPDLVNPSIFVGGDDGRIYVNQGVTTGNTKNPYTYIGWTSLGALPS